MNDFVFFFYFKDINDIVCVNIYIAKRRRFFVVVVVVDLI